MLRLKKISPKPKLLLDININIVLKLSESGGTNISHDFPEGKSCPPGEWEVGLQIAWKPSMLECHPHFDNILVLLFFLFDFLLL